MEVCVYPRFRSDVSICQKSIIALSIFTLSACSTPPQKPANSTRGDYTYTKEYISWLIKQEMDDADVTGLSIALVDDKETVWAQGFGYADKQANIKATPDTIYNVGSISKVLTATAAMQLAEQGKLDIDQPLQKYLPEFSIKSRFGDTHKITPRNIMTHHSGLPCNWLQGMIERHPGPFTEVVTAVKNEYMAYPTDYVFAYSNLGITLLGATVGKLGGTGYTNYMDTHLLSPLGMTHSEFASSTSSKSYDKGKEVEVIPMRDLPASGLNSSVSDIAHFMQMVLADGKYNGRQILKPESLREMFKVQNANVPMDLDSKVGLGWMLNGVEVPHAGTVASHGGLTMNFHALMAVLPEHRLGVVVLSNSTTAQSVVDKVAAATLKLALEAKRGITQPARVVKEVNNVPLTKDDIRAYDGYFDTLIGLIKVSGTTDDLHTEIMGQELELIPHEDKEFGVRLKLFGFIPLKIDALENVSLSLHMIEGHDVLALKSNGQSILIGEKLAPVTISENMLDYIGDYEIINKPDGPSFDSVRVLHEDGLLIGVFTFPQKNSGFVFHPGYIFRIALKPMADNAVVLDGLGPGKGETMHLKKIGGEVHISIAGLEFRKKPDKRS
jgi:CubicO group peptidase (beta-lactamase class C family)